MSVQRQPIYDALYALVQKTMLTVPLPNGSEKIPSFSNRFTHWSQVSVAQMPAVNMQQYEEEADQVNNMGLTRWRSTVNVWIYFNASNPQALPDQTYNAVLDALETALKPSPTTGRQSLGGLVTHTWIDGKVPYSDGALDHKAVILVQIKILWGGQ